MRFLPATMKGYGNLSGNFRIRKKRGFTSNGASPFFHSHIDFEIAVRYTNFGLWRNAPDNRIRKVQGDKQ